MGYNRGSFSMRVFASHRPRRIFPMEIGVHFETPLDLQSVCLQFESYRNSYVNPRKSLHQNSSFRRSAKEETSSVLETLQVSASRRETGLVVRRADKDSQLLNFVWPNGLVQTGFFGESISTGFSRKRCLFLTYNFEARKTRSCARFFIKIKNKANQYRVLNYDLPASFR